MSTMRDVANRAGVSIQTVSNVVNGRALMTEETRTRVNRAMVDLGYSRNHHARMLRRQACETLAFIVVDPAERFLADEFHDLVLAGVSDALRDRNYCLLIQQVLTPQTPLVDLRPLAEGRVDGAIMTGSRALQIAGTAKATIRLTSRPRVPIVVLEQEAGDASICSVRAHNYAGGAALGEHLVARGRTRFAFVRGLGAWPAVEQRLAGVRDALRGHGLSCDLTVSSAWDAEAACQAIVPLLHAHPRLDAIIGANDVLALGAMKAVRRAGRAVPGDVAVVGFDDFGFSSCVEPALTTVTVPGYEMGRTAVEMILACLTSGSFPQHEVCFPTTLVVRDSS